MQFPLITSTRPAAASDPITSVVPPRPGSSSSPSVSSQACARSRSHVPPMTIAPGCHSWQASHYLLCISLFVALLPLLSYRFIATALFPSQSSLSTAGLLWTLFRDERDGPTALWRDGWFQTGCGASAQPPSSRLHPSKHRSFMAK